MSITDHFEKYLGPMSGGWEERGGATQVQVVKFIERPFVGEVTYATLGLSEYVLRLPSKEIRHELVMAVRGCGSACERAVVSMLLGMCERAVESGKGFLRGEVIPLPEEFRRAVFGHSLYCAIPVLFDDEFCISCDTVPPTVIVMLLPISLAESEFVSKCGWEAFEELLESSEVDVLKIGRAQVI